MIIILSDQDIQCRMKSIEDIDASLSKICGGRAPILLASHIIYSGSEKPGYIYYFKSRSGLEGWHPESTINDIDITPEV